MTTRLRLVSAAVAMGIVTLGSACGPTSAHRGSGGGTTATSTTRASGIVGTVTAGPSCPVERIDTPCPPQPVSAPINLQNVEGRTIATTKSTVDGRYELLAPAGRYTIIVKTDVFPRCPATPATVTPHQLTTVDVSCDSGIR